MTDKKLLSENLTWFLDELALAEPEQFECGSLEVICEDENGNQGSIEFEVTDLALAASSRIKELENPYSILMTRDNPNGFKLEDLAEKLRCEIQEKSINVAGDKSIEAQTVVNNNAQIIGLLFQIEAIQRQSFVVMSQIAPDTGAAGTPRIGD